MRQASWIAFLLFTVGLLTYEASIGPSSSDANDPTPITVGNPPPDPGAGVAEGGGDLPPNQ